MRANKTPFPKDIARERLLKQLGVKKSRNPEKTRPAEVKALAEIRIVPNRHDRRVQRRRWITMRRQEVKAVRDRAIAEELARRIRAAKANMGVKQ